MSLAKITEELKKLVDSQRLEEYGKWLKKMEALQSKGHMQWKSGVNTSFTYAKARMQKPPQNSKGPQNDLRRYLNVIDAWNRELTSVEGAGALDVTREAKYQRIVVRLLARIENTKRKKPSSRVVGPLEVPTMWRDANGIMHEMRVKPE